MEARNLAAVGLSLMLAVNCFMPCYTLAYADDSTDGGAAYERIREDKQQCAGDGQADQGADLQGVLRYEASEEAPSGSEILPASGACRVRPSAHVLVEASYSLADSLIRLASARAYADELEGVDSVSQEEQEEVFDPSGGLELAPGVGESIVDAANGGAATEGHGSDDGATEGAGEASSGLDGGLDNNENFFKLVLSFLEDITYLLGEIADYYRSGTVPGAGDGIVALAGYGGSLTGGFGGAFSGGSGVGKVANTTDSVDAFTAAWGWGYGGTAVFYKTSPAGWLQSIRDATSNLFTLLQKQWGYGYGGTAVIESNSPAAWLQSIRDSALNLSSIRNYLRAEGVSGNDWSLATFAQQMYNHQRAVWGYGYGSTAITETNSPGGWLQAAKNALMADQVLDETGTSFNRSAANLLYYIGNKLYQTKSYLELMRPLMISNGVLSQSGTSSARSLADLALIIANNQYSARDLMISEGVLDQSGVSARRSLADLLLIGVNDVWGLRSLFISESELHETGITSRRSVADLLMYLANESYGMHGQLEQVNRILDTVTKGPEGGRVSLYSIGNAVETIKNETRDLDNLLESIDGRVAALDALDVRLANISLIADEIKKGVNSSFQWYETLHGDLSMLRHGAADLLPGYADWTVWDFLQGICFDVGQIVDLLTGLQQTLTAWGNRWDSQDLYLMEWAKRWDARPLPDLSLDMSGVESRLDDIKFMLGVAGVVENAKDVLDAIFGDMSLDVTDAAASAVGSAIQNAFPFCVPAVLKQILGLLQADPAPPEFHFDFWGAPLDFGFSDWQGLADMTSWLSRIGFAVMLFANSRRFVYSGGVAGD